MDSQGSRINTQCYRLRTVFAIVAISVMEKIAKFVIVKNIVFYLMETHGQSLRLAVENSYFVDGVASMVPLLGTFVVNKSISQRFIMSVLSSIIYFMGLTILAISEIFPSLKAYNTTLILSAVMIVLGVGGLKPCLDTLAGDQKINAWIFGLETFGVAYFSYRVDMWGWRDIYSTLAVCMIICIMIFTCLGTETYQQATLQKNDRNSNSPNRRMLIFLWLTCMLFGVLNVQTTTLFSVQSNSMSRKRSYEMSPMTIYFVSLLLMKPLIIFLEKILVILFSTTNKISILKRTVFGMIFACVAMICAAIVEKERLVDALDLDTKQDRKLVASRVTIFWILPQGMLLAAADTFIFIGVEECVSDHFPSSLINLATIFYTTAIGAGSLMSWLLIKFVNPITQELDGNGKTWIHEKLNTSRIYKVYEFLIAIVYGPIIMVLVGWNCFCRSLDRPHDIGMRADLVFSVGT